MLRALTQKHGNWVRVGDPNQAINTTFTSADVRFLRNFVEEHIDLARDLPNSGRSTRPIIDLANALINWSRTAHPHLPPEETLAPPLIEPVPLGDPQPNPEPGTPPYYFHTAALSPEREVEMVIRSVARWLPDNPNKTVAILSPENRHGFRITEAMQQLDIPFDDTLLRSNLSTRVAAQVLSTVVGYIAQPQVTAQLERVWREVWWPRLGPPQLTRLLRVEQGSPVTPDDELPMATSALRKQELPAPVLQFSQALRNLHTPESFVFPSPRDWLNELAWLDAAEGMRAVVTTFRTDLQRWTRAAVLPIDELLLTIGAELFTEPADLALTHHLAVVMAKLADEHANGRDQWRLPELARELDNIAQNRRRVLNFNDNDGGYQAVPGKVTVATIHAAKGLEWDRVYLTACNNFSFPSGSESDKYRSERYWARENLNLVSEAVEQVRQLAMGSLDDYTPGPATQSARLAIAAERLRLFYVGITRARQELIITYNTGRSPENDPNPPALAFEALRRLGMPQGNR
jgi:DNA helicase-2/ATP-dependent DNA helicase PcrA